MLSAFQRFHLYRYGELLQEAPVLKTGRLWVREGLVVQAEDLEGVLAWAEIAPFPGLSPESLDDCILELQALKSGGLNCPRSASVAWGLYQLQHPPAFHAHSTVALNALLTHADPEHLKRECSALYTQGYRCFKLKVGQLNVAEDLLRIHALCELKPDIYLRLDANRSWSLAETLTVYRSISQEQLDYFEEPLLNPADYPHLWEHAQIPIALDESLPLFQKATWINQVKAFVLKPMLLGPELTWELVETAKSLGIPCIWSSVFESSWGLTYLASLADSDLPMGLDTWRAWARDIWCPHFKPENASVNFSTKRFTVAPKLRLKWVSTV